MKGLSQLRFLINFIQTTQIREAMVIMMMRRVLGNSLQVQSKSHDASSPLISGIGALKLPCRIFKTEHDPAALPGALNTRAGRTCPAGTFSSASSGYCSECPAGTASEEGQPCKRVYRNPLVAEWIHFTPLG